MTKPIQLTDILKKINDNIEGNTVKIKTIVEVFENRGYGPLLLAPALITLLPTGGIPGVPTLAAIMIIIFAFQIIIGKKSPWLPKKLKEKTIEVEKLNRTIKKITPYTKKIDQYIKPRMEQLTTENAIKIISVFCIGLALCQPLLEFMPFVAAIPAFSIAIFAVGISAHDGLLILMALTTSVMSCGALVYWFI